MKKLISLLIIISLVFSLCSFNINAKELARRPYDNYYSMQNPPDFSWGYTQGAEYTLIVAKNKELTEDVIEIKGLKKNLYNFDKVFEPGEYYWSYKTNNGTLNPVFRFYIAENASEFPVKYNYDNLSVKLPDKHPRLLITEENIHHLKNISSSDYTYKILKKEVDSGIRSGTPVLTSKIPISSISSRYTEKASLAARSAMLYLTNSEEKYKEFAIDMISALTVKNENGGYIWSPENAVAPNSNGKYFSSDTDSYICLFALYISLAYDWMYNDMSDSLRSDTEGLIESILKTISDEWAQDIPYDSLNIYKGFVGSHIYRLNQAIVPALAIYDKTGTDSYSHNIVKHHLPVMINITHPFSYQDGNNAQGLFYGLGNELSEVADILRNLEIIDLKSKPILKNMPYRYIYNWSVGQRSVFGDNYDSNPDDSIHSYHYRTATQYLAATNENPLLRQISKWLYLNSKGYFPEDDFYYQSHIPTYLTNEIAAEESERVPDMLPSSKYFKDTGWVSMNSSLEDEEKISMRFKSSPYGSYNHSHPDQNSFVIEAFGEYLAIDSDYYDSYHTDFDLSWNKKTYAHNAITYNNGIGQPYNTISASGEITSFLTGGSMDFTSGDATTAYNKTNEVFDKVKRNIVYLKPDVFIIIDDIASKSDELSYEYWLNTRGVIKYYENTEVMVQSGKASMFSDLLYPSGKVKFYEHNFNSPDGTVVSPDIITNSSMRNNAKKNKDSRICYITEPSQKQKIVTSLSFSDNGKNPVETEKIITEDCIIVKVTDKNSGELTKVYINNGFSETVNIDNLTFKGDAVVVSEEGQMLINGTELIKDDKTIFSSDVKVSVLTEDGKVSLSSIENDAKISVYTGPVEKINKTEDENEIELFEGEYAYGVMYNEENGYTEFEIYPGTYSFNLNDTINKGKIEIAINCGENGRVEGNKRIVSGTDTVYRVIADEGYTADEILLNGKIMYADSMGRIYTPVLNRNSVLKVTFGIPDITKLKVPCYEKVFSITEPDGYTANTVFGAISNQGYEVSDCGIIYSYENFDFKLKDVNGSTIRKLPAELPVTNSRFGITVKDKTVNSPSEVYARTYMTAGGVTVYGDIIGFDKE